MTEEGSINKPFSSYQNLKDFEKEKFADKPKYEELNMKALGNILTTWQK